MEWVSRNDLKEPKKIFEDAIKSIRKKLKERPITFEYFLVGSAKRNLVLSNNNKGFDCDYQIVIQKNKQNITGKKLKDLFKIELDAYLTKQQFNNGEDSTQSITYKRVKKGSIEFGYDIVIIRYNNENFEILKNEKDINNSYHFVQMKEMRGYREKFKMIKGSDSWKLLRDIYKKKREKNEGLEKDKRKKSYQILNEAVNEIIDKGKRNDKIDWS